MAIQDDIKAAYDAGDYEAVEKLVAQAEAQPQGNPVLGAVREAVPGLQELPAVMENARTTSEETNRQLSDAAGPDPMGRLRQEVIYGGGFNKAILQGGHLLSQWGGGLQDLGNTIGREVFDQRIATNRRKNESVADRAVRLAKERMTHENGPAKKYYDALRASKEEADATETIRNNLTTDTGAWGVVGEMPMYWASGLAAGPVISKAATLALDAGVNAVSMSVKAAARKSSGLNDWLMAKGTNAAARTKALADAGIVPPRLITPTLGLDTAAIKPLVDKAIPTLTTPNRWLDRELIDPIRTTAAVRAASKNDLPLVPLRANNDTSILGMTVLGGLENSINDEKTVLSGLAQGFTGAVAAAGLRPFVTRATGPGIPDEVQASMKRLAKGYGIKYTPGERTNIKSYQVDDANMRHRPETQDMMQQWDANNQAKLTKAFADGLGIPRPTGNGLSKQQFADHMSDIDKRFRGIEESSTGQFTPDTMARVNTHVANLGRDVTLPVDVKDFANQTRLAMHGYQNADRTFQARSFSDPEMKAIDAQLKKIARSVPELPKDRDLYDEFFQNKADAQRDLERLRMEYIAMRADPLVGPAELESAKQWGVQARDKFNAMDSFEKAAARYPKHSSAALQKSAEDLRKLLGFNTQTQAASNFLTSDALKVINGHISAIETKIASDSPKFAPYKATAKEHRALLDALGPLKMNLASVDDAGVVTLDGLRLKNLREGVNSKVNDFRALNRGADARALRPLLDEIDQATRYNPDHPLIPNAEAAAATRRDYALMNIAADNRFVNADMRMDPTAITKYMESDAELMNLMQGKHTVPQKQILQDIAALDRYRKSMARTTQNNVGSAGQKSGGLFETPAAHTPSRLAEAKLAIYLSGYPGTTGLLNMYQKGPWSIYPFVHGIEQAANATGKVTDKALQALGLSDSLKNELNKPNNKR